MKKVFLFLLLGGFVLSSLRLEAVGRGGGESGKDVTPNDGLKRNDSWTKISLTDQNSNDELERELRRSPRSYSPNPNDFTLQREENSNQPLNSGGFNEDHSIITGPPFPPELPPPVSNLSDVLHKLEEIKKMVLAISEGPQAIRQPAFSLEGGDQRGVTGSFSPLTLSSFSSQSTMSSVGYLINGMGDSVGNRLAEMREESKRTIQDQHNNKYSVLQLPFLRQSSIREEQKEENLERQREKESKYKKEGRPEILKKYVEAHETVKELRKPPASVPPINNSNTGQNQRWSEQWANIKADHKQKTKELSSFLPRRTAIETDNPKEEDLTNTFEEINKIGDEVISITEVELKDENDSNKLGTAELAKKILLVIQKAEMFALGCQSAFYIECAKNDLANAQDDLGEVKEEAGDIASKIDDALTSFLYHKVFSPREAYESAKESADLFWKEAKRIEGRINNDENKVLPKMKSGKGSSELELEELNTEINNRKLLLIVLQEAALACERLADEAWIEVKCDSLSEMKKSIVNKINSLMSEVSEDDQLVPQLSRLLEIINDARTDGERGDWKAQNPLEFLRSLESSLSEDDEKEISVVNGKFVLVSPGERALKELHDDEKRKQRTVMNTLRLILMHEAGSDFVWEFDHLFEEQQKNSIPLTVKDVKNFYKYAKDQHPEDSHFISPLISKNPIDLPMGSLQRAYSENSKKVIKGEPQAKSFNPFKQTSPVKVERTSHLDQLKEGKEQAKLLAQEHLKKEILDEHEYETALERIHHDIFHDSKKELRVEGLLNSIKREESKKNKEKESWWRTHKEELVKGAAYGTASGLFSLGVSHPGPLLLLLPHSWPVCFVVGASVAGTYWLTKTVWPTTEESR